MSRSKRNSRKERRQRIIAARASGNLGRSSNRSAIDAASSQVGCFTFGAFFGGIFLVCFGLMCFNMTWRVVPLWLYRDQYISTEMEVLHFTPHGDPPHAHVRILATGEEINTHEYGSYLAERIGPGGMVGVPISNEEAVGRRIPIWYRANAAHWLADLRIATVREGLPTFAHVARCIAMQLAALVIGFMLVRMSFRRLKTLKLDPNVDYD